MSGTGNYADLWDESPTERQPASEPASELERAVESAIAHLPEQPNKAKRLLEAALAAARGDTP